MGNGPAAARRYSRQAIDAAHACPRCNTGVFPAELCDEHRCTAPTLNGSRCTKSRTRPELGVCGVHARAALELRAEELPAYPGDDGDMVSRVIRRLRSVPGNLGAMDRFHAQFTINADEFLAEVLLGDGDKGAQLREAGCAALAGALGL